MRKECRSAGLLAITTVADGVVKWFSLECEFRSLAKAGSVVDFCFRHSGTGQIPAGLESPEVTC